MSADPLATHPTRAVVHLDRLGRNLALLRSVVGDRPIWPAVKADAYGHGAVAIARELVARGCDTLCVAFPIEAVALRAAGIRTRIVVLAVGIPEQADLLAAPGLEPVVCTREIVEALDRAAARSGHPVDVHVEVDTGMGRIGIEPEAVPAFLDRCAALPGIRVVGLMSHFPTADAADKRVAREQIRVFRELRDRTRDRGIRTYHMANSAAIFDLPDSHLDAVRPGIALYGLAPSATVENPRVRELEPVLEWKSQITFLKEVPAGRGLSYGHTHRTSRPALVATIPVGYGDGLPRNLSNATEVLVGGVRCPQIGTITMDQSLVDVTALRGRVQAGDEVVLIGRQGDACVTADELAAKLGTIHYEVVTRIAPRVPRVAPDGTLLPGVPS